MSDDGEGCWYVITEHIHDQALAQLTCDLVLDVLMPRIAHAEIDAVSAHLWAMGEELMAVQDELVALNKRRHPRHSSPEMNVDIHPSDSYEWSLFRRYAAWSIDVRVDDADDQLIANFHDGGDVISVRMSTAEAAALADRLAVVSGGRLHLELEEEFIARGTPEIIIRADTQPRRRWRRRQR